MVITGFSSVSRKVAGVGRVTMAKAHLSDTRFKIEMIRHAGGKAVIMRLLFDGVSCGSQLVKQDQLQQAQGGLVALAKRIAGSPETQIITAAA